MRVDKDRAVQGNTHNLVHELREALEAHEAAMQALRSAQFTVTDTLGLLGKAIAHAVERDFDIIFPVIVQTIAKHPSIMRVIVRKVFAQYGGGK